MSSATSHCKMGNYDRGEECPRGNRDRGEECPGGRMSGHHPLHSDDRQQTSTLTFKRSAEKLISIRCTALDSWSVS